MSYRVHVLLREPLSRNGGLHSYCKMLARGQQEIGLQPVYVSEISRRGEAVRNPDIAWSDLVRADTRVHYHFAHGARPVLRAHKTLRRLESVFHFHGPWFLEGAVQGAGRLRVTAKYLYELDVYRRFDRFVTASAAFARVLHERFRIEKNRIRVLEPAIDAQMFYPVDQKAAREQLGLSGDAAMILSVRRLEPRMGLDSLIESMSRLDASIELHVVGQGTQRSRLEKLASDFGVRDRVHFAGRVASELLPLYYSAADVSVVPTKALEGYGMVVLESMACGTPVLASRVGGLTEAMGEFAQDYMFDAGSVSQIASKVAEVLSGALPVQSDDLRSRALRQEPSRVASRLEDMMSQW